MNTSIPKISSIRFTALALAVLVIVSLKPPSAFTSDKLAPSTQSVAADVMGGDEPLLAADDGTGQQARLHVDESYGNVPLRFEANHGQTDMRVKFLARVDGYNLFLTSAEAVLALSNGRGVQSVVRARLHGANPAAQVRGVECLPGRSNYFTGNDPSRWRVNIPNYAKVHYKGVYPGIDLVYYGNQARLEYDFVVAPGADPAAVKLQFEGARRLRLNARGDLVISSGAGEVRLLKPVIYQEGGGSREVVKGRYVRLRGKNLIGFKVAAYDRSRPLVIDPIIEYATFLGGNGDDRGLGLAVNSQGSAYVAGLTTSSDFPVRGTDPPAALNGMADAFVTKFNPDGSVLWSTYYGGPGAEQARAIAVDPQGHAYITGVTDSPNYTLPTTENAFQRRKGATTDTYKDTFTDAFVAKLDADDGALVYGTYLGGWRPETGDAIAVDAAGRAYVTGNTGSYVNGTVRAFPTTPGAFQTNYGGGNSAAFVTRLSPSGDAVEYSTFLGGLGNNAGSTFGDTSPDDLGLGIAVNSAGEAVITGRTESERFPVLNAAQPDAGGGLSDAFVTKLNSTGTGIIFSTFLGGAGEENRNVGAVAVGADDQIYLTGATNSTNFPVLNAIQPNYGGNPENEAFVTKLSGSGQRVYSTYLGSSNFKRGFGIAVDPVSKVFVTGTNLLRKISADGASLIYSETLGGEGRSVALDAQGGIYVTGITTSTVATKCTPGNFCATLGAHQPSPGGGTRDAFVVKFKTDNRAPAANAGVDKTVWVVGTTAQAKLDGRDSADPDGDPLTYVWRDSGGNVVGNAAQVSPSPLPLGPHVFTLTTTDPYGASDSDDVTINVADNTPPVLTLPADITVVATTTGNATVAYTALATDNIDPNVSPVCSPASGSTLATGTHVVECTATDSSGNVATGSFEITVLSPRDASKNRYIDFERYPGADGVYGTGDAGEACAQHGDDLLLPPGPTPTPSPGPLTQRYESMGVTFTLVGGGTPVIVTKNSPFVAGSPHALKPMTKADFTTRPGDQSRLKDFDIYFTKEVKRVKISALDADEPWELIAYNAQQTIVSRVKYDGGSNTAVRSLEVRGEAIKRVRVNIRQDGETCCDAGPEFFDLLEYEPAEPPALTNTRFVDFERTPGADGVQGTGDDVNTSAGDSISDQYAAVGVTFRLTDGSAPTLRVAGHGFDDSPLTLYPVSDPAANQTQMQNLEMTFTKPVSRVKFYAIDADEAWRVRVYSRAGALIYDNSYSERSNNSPFAVEFRVAPCSSPENLIGRALIIPTKSGECCHSGPEFYDLLEFDPVSLITPPPD